MALDFDNYIFDLYGTLVDIHTDEWDMRLWEQMAAIYAVYGADYTAASLRERYESLVKERETALGKALHTPFPEIDLEGVFAELLRAAPAGHASSFAPGGKPVREASAASLRKSGVTFHIANTFRVLSRRRFRLYDGLIALFENLKAHGRRIYLLSNAQEIFTVPEMQVLGIYGFFDGIYISSRRQLRKPSPDFIGALMAEQALEPARSVMVGNECEADMGSACSAGIQGVFLNTDGLADAEIERRLALVLAQHPGADRSSVHVVRSAPFYAPLML